MDEKDMKDKDVKILAVVGMSGSGKSVVVDHLTDMGFPKVYFGGMIYKEMERRGIERTPDGESEKHFREMIRETEGKDWVVKQAIKEAKELIAAGQKRVILDGLYTWTEYKLLRKEFPGQMTVVAVVVDKDLRHKRVAKRPERPFNAEEIQERDRSEIENLEKGGPIAMADYYVLNNFGVAELESRVDEILAQIEF
jgi:dephospho-CoA kinase